MKTIHKLVIPIGRSDLYSLPADVQFLHVDIQPRRESGLCVWVLLDPKAPTIKWELRAPGTGWELPDDPGAYVGTTDLPDGTVWHVFAAHAPTRKVRQFAF